MDKSQEEEYLWKVLIEAAGRRFPVWDTNIWMYGITVGNGQNY